MRAEVAYLLISVPIKLMNKWSELTCNKTLQPHPWSLFALTLKILFSIIYFFYSNSSFWLIKKTYRRQNFAYRECRKKRLDTTFLLYRGKSSVPVCFRFSGSRGSTWELCKKSTSLWIYTLICCIWNIHQRRKKRESSHHLVFWESTYQG